MEEKNNQNFEKQEFKEEVTSAKTNIKKRTLQIAIIIATSIVAVIAIIIVLIILFGNKNNTDLAPHTHTFGEWEIAKTATCTTEGSKTRYCNCGEIQISSIQKNDHIFGEWYAIKEATTTETGLKEQYCSCGEKRTEIIEKIFIITTVSSSEWKEAFNFSGCTELSISANEYISSNDSTISAEGKFTFYDDVCYMDYILIYNGEKEVINEYESCSKIQNFGNTVFSDILREFWDEISSNSDLGFLRFVYNNETSSYYSNIDIDNVLCKVDLFFENGILMKINIISTSSNDAVIHATYKYEYK